MNGQEDDGNQMKLTSVLLLAGGLVSGQTPPPNNTFHGAFIAHTTPAINYLHRSGATKIDFKGTSLLPAAHGEAKVESKQGYISIEVEFRDLQPANRNGAEYLTYVLWAVTPEGRTANLGEILLNGSNSKLDVTTELQVFGLIVTAEPYYAVTQPSDLIVMENVVRPDTRGEVERVDAKYELFQRGQYEKLANPLELKTDKRIPLELYEARNAVSIARSIGADQVAPESFAKATNSLAQAEADQRCNAGHKPVTMMAREAVQMAEDSRAITVKRQRDTERAAERQQSVDSQVRAENGRLAAESETGRVIRDAAVARMSADAEAQRLTRERDTQAAASVTEADRVKRETDARMAAVAGDADRLRLENDAKAAAAQAANASQMTAAENEADRLKRENDSRTASAKAESDLQLAAAGNEADRLKRENDAQRAASQAELDAAARQRTQLETEKANLRLQLLQQFNAILQTRDTARGLIVNMSDVLFDTGKFSLRRLAREKLAKVAGIVSGHPGLKLAVEGYTDSVGGDDYNQQLSEQRGESVRDFLTQQGMPSASVTSKGFGKSMPVASNDNAEGRQQNRRVELVVSGDIIGTEIGKVIAIQ